MIAWSFDRVAPDRLGYVSQRFHTPVVAIWTFIGGSAVLTWLIAYRHLAFLTFVEVQVAHRVNHHLRVELGSSNDLPYEVLSERVQPGYNRGRTRSSRGAVHQRRAPGTGRRRRGIRRRRTPVVPGWNAPRSPAAATFAY